MKKYTFVYLAVACVGSLILSGYHSGAASSSQYDCTGAETGLQNPAGCTAGCHTASTAITVAIELDSAGVPTTHYKGGMTYTVKLSGTNTSTTVLPKFGFQMGSIKGSSAVVTPVNAGTWSTTCPTGTHYAPPSLPNGYVVGVVEQSLAIAATSGTGGAGTTYVKSFSWTAPAVGTGIISFWGVINAVNGDGGTSGDKTNTNHVAINEWGGSTTTGIANAENTVSDFKLSLFPNPASDNIHLTYSLNKSSMVSVKMFDLNGRLVANLLDETQNEGGQSLDAGISNLNKGIYFVILNVDGLKTAKRVVIQ